jgi:hypothetical protein
VTVHADVHVAVEGTYGPLVYEGLKRSGNGGEANGETMGTTWVPGERHNGYLSGETGIDCPLPESVGGLSIVAVSELVKHGIKR